MSRNRLVFSRPRTKVYDANYSIGENYYKSALDGIDRKYGKAAGSEQSALAGSLRASLDRERDRPVELASPRTAFRELEDDGFSEELGRKSTSRMSEFDSLLESRLKNGIGDERSQSRMMKAFEDDVEEDLVASMKRLKAVRAARALADDLEDMETNAKRGERSLRSKLDFSDKVMDSVGLSGKARAALEDEGVSSQRKVLKITSVTTTASESSEGDNLTRWTALKSGTTGRKSNFADEDGAIGESSAAARARKSRAMLDDIESEMQAIAERGAAREKRARDLKALVQENEANSKENLQSVLRIKNSLQSEKKIVSF